jgi:hypothetical protein
MLSDPVPESDPVACIFEHNCLRKGRFLPSSELN